MSYSKSPSSVLAVAFALLAAVLPAAPAAAHEEAVHPAQIAAACIAWTQQRTETRTDANAAFSSAAADEIVARLEAGDPEGAAELAQRSKLRITRKTAEAIEAITERTSDCAAVLLALGKPGLAGRVLDARAKAVPQLLESRQAAVAVIDAALGG